MLTNRLLLIDRLVLQLPDTMTGTGYKGQLTLEDCLQYLLDHIRSDKAKHANLYPANNDQCYGNFPLTINPESPDFTTGYLMQYLADDANSSIDCAGMLLSAQYDAELGAFMPTQSAKLYDDFVKMKRETLEHRHKVAEHTAELQRISKDPNQAIMMDDVAKIPHTYCDGCEYDICNERCPYNQHINEEEDAK